MHQSAPSVEEVQTLVGVRLAVYLSRQSIHS
jgi:hypothetical protein